MRNTVNRLRSFRQSCWNEGTLHTSSQHLVCQSIFFGGIVGGGLERTVATMAELKANGKAVFTLEGEEIVLEMDDVLYDTAEKGGFVSSTNKTLTVVLDTNLTPELVEEGFVREIISKVQTMRKEADFNVTDRIKVYHDGNAKIAEVLAANDITGDVLADEVVAGVGGELSKEWNINGEKVTLGVARV